MNYTTLLSEQRKFFNTEKTKDVEFRIEQLKKLKKILHNNEQKLYDAIYQDFKKSEFDTYLTELGGLYHEIDYFVKNLRKWSRRKKVRTDLTNIPGKSFIIPESLGCTLVIGAWNFPYRLSLMPVIAALGAGNTVILKPSEVAKNTSSVMAEIINSNFDKKVFYVIEGGVEETTELLKLKFDKIFYTGSTRVGKIIYEAAAKNLTPVTLELGGKSPAFVLKDSNLKIAAQRIVWSKFTNAGQTCVAPDYLMVEQSVKVKLLTLLKAEVEKYYSQTEIRENYTQIINQKNYERLVRLIDRSKLYVGGNCDESERFIGPTILRKVTFDDEVMKEEIFGPILPVIAFGNLDEAIEQVRCLPKPLACYVYSTSKKSIDKILNRISFGGGAVNDSLIHLSNNNLPFGGVGMSGIGNYHGKYGFDAFSHKKGIVKRYSLFELPFKYFPYTSLRKRIIKSIFRIS